MATEQKMRDFGSKQWLVLFAFVAALTFTVLFAVRATRRAAYWRSHQEEPIKPWMTIGYVAHSYHVPPRVLYEALGIPQRVPDKRPIREIAKEEHKPVQVVIGEIQTAVAHARPPSPAASPPPAGPRGGRSP